MCKIMKAGCEGSAMLCIMEAQLWIVNMLECGKYMFDVCVCVGWTFIVGHPLQMSDLESVSIANG